VRIKTDRRDARKLAELFRAGLLTEVHPPSETDEALRDLCRCRDDVRVDLLRARHRLSKFLLRRHCIYRQTKHHWDSRHVAWLEQLRFDDAMSQATFDSYQLAVQQLEERQRQLDTQLAEFGGQEPYREPVAWLRCFLWAMLRHGTGFDVTRLGIETGPFEKTVTQLYRRKRTAAQPA
jgi:transposase